MNDIPVAALPQEEAPPFFQVSRLKLAVMSVVTFGIYEIYWFYKNWTLVKQRTGREIQPFWRAFFGFFFCHSLLGEVKKFAASRGLECDFSPDLLTVAWIGLTLCSRLPEPFWFISFLAVFALLPVQKTINELNAQAAPNLAANNRFTGWNIAGVIFGGLLLLLGVIGAFLPEQ